MSSRIRNLAIAIVVLAALALAGSLLLARNSTGEETTVDISNPGTTPSDTEVPGASMPPPSEPMDGSGDGHGDHHDHGGAANPDGFALSAVQDGYLLAPVSEMIAAQAGSTYQFRILGPDGEPVTEFDVVHEQKMHVLMVSQDLQNYGHIHPTMDTSGLWTIDYPFPVEGRWRIVADFTPAGGAPMALGVWTVVGADRPVETQVPVSDVRTSEAGGYVATLDGDTAHEKPRPLTFIITRDGDPVASVDPYLGANGHLVGFLTDDYSYVHMHPNDGFADGQMVFTAPAMAHGYWRLFLQVRLDGELLTFPFVINGK